MPAEVDGLLHLLLGNAARGGLEVGIPCRPAGVRLFLELREGKRELQPLQQP